MTRLDRCLTEQTACRETIERGGKDAEGARRGAADWVAEELEIRKQMVKPYYEHGGVTIYCGDCREILPTLPPVDLVLTDPPYGIASVWKGGFSPKHGWGKAEKESSLRNEWDESAPDRDTLALALSKAKDAVLWGANYFTVTPSRGWLVWNKPERGFTLSEAELAWTTRDMPIRVKDLHRSDAGRQHPTQKPLDLMLWCLGFFPNAQTVLDPFMGSGTTLVAAKNLNRRAIGIEIEERYCELAAKRLEQEVLDFGPAPKEPEQLALGGAE